MEETMPTINDIASELGISKGTVSKALNNADDISESLRKKVLEKAVEMGYEKNRIRKNLNKKLCILVENMDYTEPTHFGYDIVMGFRQLAVPDDWQVDVVPITKEMQLETSYDVFMLKNEYQGAFILGLSLLDPWLEELKTSRTPAVLYDNYIPYNPTVSYVGTDNTEGIEQAIKHLKELGHTKIGYLGGALDSLITRTRYEAFQKALQVNDLEFDPNLVGTSYFISECTQKHLPSLLKQDVTAVLCSHDLLAHAVITECQECGYNVPKDISIIGFDDAPFSAYTNPPLTTVRQSQREIGKCSYFAFVNLQNQIAIGKLLLRSRFIERSSTGPVRTGALKPSKKVRV